MRDIYKTINRSSPGGFRVRGRLLAAQNRPLPCRGGGGAAAVRWRNRLARRRGDNPLVRPFARPAACAPEKENKIKEEII